MAGGSAIQRAWRGVGFAGDTSFLVVTVSGVLGVGAIGTGLLAALTSIPIAFLVLAALALVAILIVIVPLVLAKLWPALAGPSLALDEWGIRGHREEGVRIARAGVSIFNGRDAGGERARARGVVPQVEIFELDGTRIYHHVGWVASNNRDFPATREEERLVLAEKRDDEKTMSIGHHPPHRRSGAHCLEGKITLRGDNLSRPTVAIFMLGLGEHGELWVKRSNPQPR